MSLLFLIGFILSLQGYIPEWDKWYTIVWALFSIADALWVNALKK